MVSRIEDQPDTTLIGETGHSVISTTVWRGKAALVKRAKKQPHRSVSQTQTQWRNEVDLLHRARTHDHVAHILDSDASTLTIILRPEPGQSLDKYIDSQQFSTLTSNDSEVLLAQIASTLAHLHSLDIVHDDVKADNIMWAGATDLAPARAVLIDFGAAFDQSVVGLNYFVPNGTPSWTPPEFLNRRKGKEGDVWSLGVVMLFARRLTPLPDGEWMLPDALEDGEAREAMLAWLRQVESLRGQIVDSHPLVARMLDSDPDARIGSRELHSKCKDRS